MRGRHSILVASLFLLILASCKATTNTPMPTSTPTPAPFTSVLPSPAHSPLLTSPLESEPIYVYTIDVPLTAGQTEVSGTGPEDIPIRIVDVTAMGAELGAGVIGQDGRFSIHVTPLPAGHRIGIMLGRVSDPDKSLALQRHGQDIPLIGTVLTTTMTLE